MNKHNTIVSILYNKELENKQIFLSKKAVPRILVLWLTPTWKRKNGLNVELMQ